MAWTALCPLDRLRQGEGNFIEKAGRQLAVFLRDGAVHVVDNYCPHAGGSLSGGYLEADCVVCPWHHWAFRLDTGQLTDRSMVKIGVYPARIVDGPGGIRVVEADLP